MGAMAQGAISVFDIEPGVAALGAGGTGIATVNGAETLYYNPAGLSELPGISFSSFYASHLGVADITAMALTFRNWGIGFQQLRSGDIAGYDDEGNPTDTLAYRNTGLVFGFGLDPSELAFLPSLPIDMSIGGTLKYATADIGGSGGSGFTFDLGFRSGIPPLSLGPIRVSDVAFGITAVNLFGAMTYEVGSEERFPMDLRIAASARAAEVLVASLDLHLTGPLHAGVAYYPVQAFAIRAGIITGDALKVTAGVGVSVQGFLIDYAFASHTLGATHRVSLSLDFSGLDIAALSGSLGRILP